MHRFQTTDLKTGQQPLIMKLLHFGHVVIQVLQEFFTLLKNPQTIIQLL